MLLVIITDLLIFIQIQFSKKDSNLWVIPTARYILIIKPGLE